MSERIESFEEFWPYYVGEHDDVWTRRLHLAGTTAALGTLAYALLKRRPALVPLALVAGYGPAWVSHFFIEKNRPATFTYPAWSLAADFVMAAKMLTGQMDAEVARVRAAKAERAAAASAPAAPPDPPAADARDLN